MTVENIVPVNALIGMTVLSKTTGNKLGQVYDLFVDPVSGLLVGLTIQTPDGVGFAALDYNEIFSFGQDAVMANSDDSVRPLEGAWLAGSSYARQHLLGAKIITESGKLLGQIFNVFVHLPAPPLAVYEIRESLLDKLLGRGFFILASSGRAMSNDAERIVVPDSAELTAAPSLEALVTSSVTPDNINRAYNNDEEETLIRESSGKKGPKTEY